MYETILIPTDGSAHAERAARHAVSLAEAFDATVTVLGVADLNRAAGAFSAGGIDDEFRERVRGDAESAVEEAAALADDRVPVETAVVDGDPAKAIVDYADEGEFDAVAMGTHGRRGLSRLVFGSVARYVVRHTTRPVLTARETDADAVTDYDDVLVPTDGSDAAEAAIDHGLAVADAFDATVHAVNIVDLSGMAAGSGVEPPTSQLERYTEAGEAAVEAVAERARAEGLDAVTAVEHGFPAADLHDYVDEAEVDLVAMGTHGRTGIDRVLLGSTTERVLSRSPAPVLAVHPDDAE
ncbi:universal stress protein [Halosimplex pelagicum]|uniref:Universal stress protein n=1 Tax=Halosimplex pelagicum TaxID=869886 RepID=A0A7D5SW97_9EURY|nr:universal stress protein [Halosimplex pelagicum]QLH82887.1 universal stress protein [Halosimplex pelagicum]